MFMRAQIFFSLNSPVPSCLLVRLPTIVMPGAQPFILKIIMQNSRIFCVRERPSIFERKVYSECKNRRGRMGREVSSQLQGRVRLVWGSWFNMCIAFSHLWVVQETTISQREVADVFSKLTFTWIKLGHLKHRVKQLLYANEVTFWPNMVYALVNDHVGPVSYHLGLIFWEVVNGRFHCMGDMPVPAS